MQYLNVVLNSLLPGKSMGAYGKEGINNLWFLNSGNHVEIEETIKKYEELVIKWLKKEDKEDDEE